VKEGLWRKYFRGTRKRCIGLPLKELKGSPILKLIKPSIPVIKEKLTWIHGSGKYVEIWKENTYERENLSTQEDLATLQAWMYDQEIHSIHEISKWDEVSRNWLGWRFGFPQEPLIPLSHSLS